MKLEIFPYAEKKTEKLPITLLFILCVFLARKAWTYIVLNKARMLYEANEERVNKKGERCYKPATEFDIGKYVHYAEKNIVRDKLFDFAKYLPFPFFKYP